MGMGSLGESLLGTLHMQNAETCTREDEVPEGLMFTQCKHLTANCVPVSSLC